MEKKKVMRTLMLKDLHKEKDTDQFQVWFGKTGDDMKPVIEKILHLNRVKPKAYVLEHYEKLEDGKVLSKNSKPKTLKKVADALSKIMLKEDYDFMSIVFEEEMEIEEYKIIEEDIVEDAEVIQEK